MSSRWWFYGLFGLAAIAAAIVLVVGYAMVVAYPNLPSLEALTSYQPKIPLQIFSVEGDLIGEFGEEKRAFVKIEQTPDILRTSTAGSITSVWYAPHCLISPPPAPDRVPVPSPCRLHETSFFPPRRLSAASSMKRCSRSRSSTA
jgi:hypothetical protein